MQVNLFSVLFSATDPIRHWEQTFTRSQPTDSPTHPPATHTPQPPPRDLPCNICRDKTFFSGIPDPMYFFLSLAYQRRCLDFSSTSTRRQNSSSVVLFLPVCASGSVFSYYFLRLTGIGNSTPPFIFLVLSH